MGDLKLPAAVSAVAVGGALGALSRYGLGELFPHIWTTLVINVVGSLILGILAALLVHNKVGYLFLGTGFCGGYTTFSTASVETVRLLQQGRRRDAAVNVTVTVLASVLACAGGLALASSM